jgi:hypothetical protein
MRTPLTTLTLIALLAGVTSSAPARADLPTVADQNASMGVADLTQKLGRLVYLTRLIEQRVERIDLPRLVMLRSLSQGVLDSMSQQGATNMLTLQKVQELVIGFRFSRDLFMMIASQRTAQAVAEMQNIGNQIARASGFDQSPHTRITASVLGKLHELTVQISRLQIPESLAQRVRQTQPAIGRVLSIAQGGDHAATFAAAGELLPQLRSLSADLNQVSSGNAAFMTALEIQGLIEYYSEFSQLDESTTGVTP